MRILTLVTLVWAGLTATLARAEPVSLEALSDYMTSLGRVQTTFTQVNDDGSVSTGLFQLRRPGRMRFEYDPPDQALVVAGAGAVAIVDKSLGTAEQYALRRTPLKLILDRQVDLTTADMVVDHYEFQGFTVVTAQDPEHPEYGSIDLVFSADPVRLEQWRVRDESGGETLVILETFEHGVDLPLRLFNVRAILEEYR